MQQQHQHQQQQPPQSQPQPQPQSQPLPPTLNSGASFSPNAITTEQIQKTDKILEIPQKLIIHSTLYSIHPKCLDDNKNLIMAILENQNLGKFQECAQYQAILQKNLMYLAAIADAQPPASQTPTPAQIPPNSVPQQANNYIQQHQAAAPQQPQQGGVPKLPFQLNALRTQDQQQQLLQLQQQQRLLALRPANLNGMLGMHQAMQSAMAGNPGNLMDGQGMKQDGSDAASGGGDGQGKSRGPGGNSG